MKTRSKATNLKKSPSKAEPSKTKKTKQSSKESKMSSKSKKKIDQNQWVMIAPDEALQSNPDGEEESQFIRLMHPKTDQGVMFMVSSDGKLIYEVTSYKEDYGSWLINETVQQDGSMKIVTPVDPIFLVLPYLRKAEKQMGKFMTLDQIVTDNNYPQCHRLLDCGGLSELERCCDVKGDDDLKAYRYNKEKALDWLKAKVERIAQTLEHSTVHCAASGSQSATFVRSSKGKEATKDDYLRYAVGLISDYLHPELSKELFAFMGIKEVEKSKPPAVKEEAVSEPPAKKAKVAKNSSSSEPEEDYSKYFAKDKKEKAKTKMTSGQRQLSKVDKTGMKSISSFFGKAPKKK